MQELRRIGLTEGEIKIYEALLELGETTRTELAKKSSISPSKIYDVANRLLEKGIISSVKKNNVLHFKAADPTRLQDFLEQKEHELQQERDVVQRLLPTLQAKYLENTSDTDVEVFYGWEGMKTVYGDISRALGPGDVNYIFGASPGKDVKQADRFFSQYYKQVAKAGYAVHIIWNENLRNYLPRIAAYNKPPHKVRFLYQDTFTEINFYKNTVLFIMLLTKPIAIRVRSEEAAESFKNFFDTMWVLAKP